MNYYCVILHMLHHGTRIGANTVFTDKPFEINSFLEEEAREFEKDCEMQPDSIVATPISITVVTKELFDANEDAKQISEPGIFGENQGA